MTRDSLVGDMYVALGDTTKIERVFAANLDHIDEQTELQSLTSGVRIVNDHLQNEHNN